MGLAKVFCIALHYAIHRVIALAAPVAASTEPHCRDVTMYTHLVMGRTAGMSPCTLTGPTPPSSTQQNKSPSGDMVLRNTMQWNKKTWNFRRAQAGGRSGPSPPTYGAAGGNFRGVGEMVYDIAIKTPLPHPNNLRLRSWKRPDLIRRSGLLVSLN